MRLLPLAALLLLVPRLALAQDAAVAELSSRIKALEAEVSLLKSQLETMKILETRVTALERILAAGDGGLAAQSELAPRSLSDPPEAIPAMPYDEDLYFLVMDARLEGKEDRTGAAKYSVEARLLEVPPEARDQLVEENLQGYRYAGLPSGIPAAAQLYRMVIEDLTASEGRFWLDAFAPVRSGASLLYRQIAFPRVPTSQTYTKGYEGNSGTVRPWRGKLYWYENSVFFIENGTLRVISGAAARFHIRFVRLDTETSLR